MTDGARIVLDDERISCNRIGAPEIESPIINKWKHWLLNFDFYLFHKCALHKPNGALQALQKKSNNIHRQ